MVRLGILTISCHLRHSYLCMRLLHNFCTFSVRYAHAIPEVFDLALRYKYSYS